MDGGQVKIVSSLERTRKRNRSPSLIDQLRGVGGPLWIVSNKDGGLFQMTRKNQINFAIAEGRVGGPLGARGTFILCYHLQSFCRL